MPRPPGATPVPFFPGFRPLDLEAGGVRFAGAGPPVLLLHGYPQTHVAWRRIAPTPLLMVVGDRDVTTLTDLALRAYRDALEPKALELFEGDHFDSYGCAFERNSRAAVAWFERHLGTGRRTAPLDTASP